MNIQKYLVIFLVLVAGLVEASDGSGKTNTAVVKVEAKDKVPKDSSLAIKQKTKNEKREIRKTERAKERGARRARVLEELKTEKSLSESREAQRRSPVFRQPEGEKKNPVKNVD